MSLARGELNSGGEKERDSNSYPLPHPPPPPLSSASSDFCLGGEEGEEEMKAEVKAEKISSRAKPGWAEG